MLPKVKVGAETGSPKRLLFYSAPKSGKTTALSMLEDCLLLDFEDGSNFVKALKIKIIGIVAPKDEDAGVKTQREIENKYYLNEVVKELKAQNNPYKYIAVDTTSGLEDMCVPLALQLYQQTPMGKTYNGDILALPQGAGYKYLRDAFEKMLNMLQGVCDVLILSAHQKDKVESVDGKEVTRNDIDLTGKLKGIACKRADAIAYLYRKGNQVRMNFKTTEEVTCGARPIHLKNVEIVITESDKDGNITAHWDRIFVD
jgi:hypothetical protein